MKFKKNNQFKSIVLFHLLMLFTISFAMSQPSSANFDLNNDGTINIMVVGSSSSLEWWKEVFSTNNIVSELQNILAADPSITANVNVVAEDIYLKKQVSFGLGQSGTVYTPYFHRHSLLQYYYWPEGLTARMDNLSGNNGTDWDYVVIASDPLILAQVPSYYFLGVNKVAAKVSEGGAKPLLLMMWPKSQTSDLTLAHSEEFTYRAANGASVPVAVVPAGSSWNALPSNKKDSSSSHPTPNGAYVAAATIYSHISGASASSSEYTYDDDIANIALSTVITEKNKTHYTGEPTFISPFKNCGINETAINYNQTGSSSEAGILGGLNWVFNQVPQTLVNGGTFPINFNYGRANTNFEANKRYKIDPTKFNFSFGFPMQDHRNHGDTSMLYGLDKRDLGTVNDTDLGVARYMVDESELPYGRAIPIRTLFAQMKEAIPNQSAYRDSWHMHLDLDKSIAAYMYTMLTGKINIVGEPTDQTSAAWKTWKSANIGHETAWSLMYLETLSAPKVDYLNSTPTDDATSVALNNNIIIDFDKNIIAGTGNIILRNITAASDTEIFDVASATATTTPIAGTIGIVSDKLYINPTSPLLESNNYAIKIATTAIKHTSGIPFVGILDETTFEFRAEGSLSVNLVNEELAKIQIYLSDEQILTIRNLPEGTNQLKIYDLLGKEIGKPSLSKQKDQTIILQKMSSGIYIVRLSTNVGAISKKIIVN